MQATIARPPAPASLSVLRTSRGAMGGPPSPLLFPTTSASSAVACAIATAARSGGRLIASPAGSRQIMASAAKEALVARIQETNAKNPVVAYVTSYW